MPILLCADLILSHFVFNAGHLYVNVWESTKYAKKKRQRPQGILSIYQTTKLVTVYVSMYHSFYSYRNSEIFDKYRMIR